MSTHLNGIRVLNTRPQHQAYPLSQQIRQAGGVAIDYPTLVICNLPGWFSMLPPLSEVTHALFTSANAVIYCFKLLHDKEICWPEHIHNIAIGQGTAATLDQYGITVHEMPTKPNSEQILNLPSMQHLCGKTLLLVKGKGGRTLIEESVNRKKNRLITLCVYQRVLPKINYQLTRSLWQDDAVDIILLTSEQSIHNLFVLFDKEAHSWLQTKLCLVVSERLATIAAHYGLKNIKLSHPNKILETLLNYKDCIHGE